VLIKAALSLTGARPTVSGNACRRWAPKRAA